jgi:glycosyltransferase involved in cell wall biosynthesis
MTNPATSKRLAVVIPSRSRPLQQDFLARAISSIQAQVVPREFAIEILVCVDRGDPAPALLDQRNVRLVEAASRGQAAALNAGAAQASADYLAFLEDDDVWHPQRMAFALKVLEETEFTSSTQLEVDENGVVARINDFPTPSGWIMPTASWHRIGPFDETYRWHLDSEWLGRLGQSGLNRIHLVEATAPVHPRFMVQVRPWLLNCIELGGANVSIGRHPLPVPLVTRLVHRNSGMATIERDPLAKQQATSEIQRLIGRYGHLPW